LNSKVVRSSKKRQQIGRLLLSFSYKKKNQVDARDARDARDAGDARDADDAERGIIL
jgi:hypothetical protein